MKKKHLITTISLLLILIVKAQTPTTVLTLDNDLSVMDMAVNGNDLYYSDFSLNGIYKIDTTEENPIPILVASGLQGPRGLCIDGNDLYIAEKNTNKIIKLNITDNFPTTAEDFITDLEQDPSHMTINGNDFYYLIDDNSTNGKLFKTDKNNPSTQIELISGLGVPVGLQVDGDYIYYSELLGDAGIKRLNITQENMTPQIVISNLNQAGFFIIENERMYIPIRFDHKIVTLNLNSSMPWSTTDLVSLDNGSGPFSTAIINNELYIGEYFEGKISKLDLDNLSIHKNDPKQTIKLFPNPSENMIQVQGLIAEREYIIYNSLGQKISEGEIMNNGLINIESFPSGIYILNFENQDYIQFIKNP